MERSHTTDLSTSGSKVEERDTHRGRDGLRVDRGKSRRLTANQYLDMFNRERRVSSALEYFPTAPGGDVDIRRVEDVPPELTLKVAAEIAKQSARHSGSNPDECEDAAEAAAQDDQEKGAVLPGDHGGKGDGRPETGASGAM